MKDYFVLYHNAEGMGRLPRADGNIMSFYTTKRLIEKAIGGECFMIVGMGRKNKQYYLWSHVNIEEVKKDGDLYIGSGPSLSFDKEILLNEVPGFAEFKMFCGNFGLGFQNINRSEFKDEMTKIVDQRLS